jgi:glycine/D-amino acid oxidase-like deaminating enzyme
MTEYRSLSFWHDTVDDDLTPRPPLPGDLDADVAIVGAGLTGLWTAWSLLQAAPSTRVVLLEREIAGFGASGRNGGWCSALFPTSTAGLQAKHGLDAAVAMRRAMIDTVDEVGRATAAAGIDCDYVKGGTIVYARDAVQRRAAHADIDATEGFGVDTLRWWDADRVGAAGALGATFDPACARLHPAKLVRGLARAVEAAGGRILEGTAVDSVEPAAAGRRARAVSRLGTVTADAVIVATEGYTPGLRGLRRRILPLYSLMIATEPLPDEIWHETGLQHGQTFSDYRHLLIYGQRTADNRFAFGGRGARYHWGSSIRPEYDRVPAVFEHLRRTLRELFPVIGDVEVTHTWGGPLGVPRDWHAGVGLDRGTGIGWAGGYVGDGLSTTNLAGRTLADLLLERNTDLVHLPWVGHRSPDWEPEPLRFIGANAGLVAMTAADAEERATGRASLVARAMGPLTGH